MWRTFTRHPVPLLCSRPIRSGCDASSCVSSSFSMTRPCCNFIYIFKGLWYGEAFTMLSAITRRKCLLPRVLIIFKLVENAPGASSRALRILLNPFYSWLLAARCTGWHILGVECRPDRVMFNMSTGNQFTLTLVVLQPSPPKLSLITRQWWISDKALGLWPIYLSFYILEKSIQGRNVPF